MSKCRVYLQVDLADADDNSPRSISLFALHRRKIVQDTGGFSHYFVVIGYGGGGVQEEFFYRIDGVSTQKFSVLFSDVSGPGEWKMSFRNQGLIEQITPFEQNDHDVQSEFQDLIGQYLIYNEELDIFLLNDLGSKDIAVDSNGKYITQLFPTYYLKTLRDIYWPFSIGFD
jgi:hypothetical protein